MGLEVDPRSDLFSLGSVMYTMCSGNSPFADSSMISTLENVRSREPVRIDEINRNVPGWLAVVVARLLQKDPKNRFPSAISLLGFMEGHMDTNPYLETLKSAAEIKPISPISANSHSMMRPLILLAASLILFATAVTWIYSQNGAISSKTNANTPATEFGEAENETVNRFVGSFQELQQALRLDQHEVVITLTDDIEIDEPIEINDKAVSISSANQSRRAMSMVFCDEPNITVGNALLELQNVTVQIEDDDGEAEECSALFEVNQGDLRLENTKIVCLAPKVCMELNESSVEVVDSLIYGTEVAIQWLSSVEQEIEFDNSLIICPACINVSDNEQAELKLTQSTLVAEQIVLLDPETFPPNHIAITANRCLFLASEAFLAMEDSPGDVSLKLESMLRQIELSGRRNLLPAVFIQDEELEKGLLFSETSKAEELETGNWQQLPPDLLAGIDLEDRFEVDPAEGAEFLADIHASYTGLGAGPEILALNDE